MVSFYTLSIGDVSALDYMGVEGHEECLIQQPVKSSIERSTQRSDDCSTAHFIERSTERVVESPTQRVVEHSSERSINHSASQNSNICCGEPPERSRTGAEKYAFPRH